MNYVGLLEGSESEAHVFADGACIPTAIGSAAGYGVFCDHVQRCVISEPLPGRVQTSQKAEVKALLSALEFVWATRGKNIVIISDSRYAVNGYTQWMNGWRREDWNNSMGEEVAHRELWEEIVKYPPRFINRFLKVTVRWEPRNSREGMIKADGLAKLGCKLHVQCKYCVKKVGRADGMHECFPVCSEGNCSDRLFGSRKAYKDHMKDAHSGDYPCRRGDCNVVLGSLKSVLSHEINAHNGYVFDCEYCTSVSQSEEEKDEHEENYCRWSPYCHDCDRWFKVWSSYMQHNRDAHGIYS